MNLQRRIAAHARGNPAPGQGSKNGRNPGMGEPGHPARVCHHAAPVPLVRVAPSQGRAGTRAAAGDEHPQRAGFGQAAHATPVAGRAQGGLPGGVGVPPHHDLMIRGLYRHAWMMAAPTTGGAERILALCMPANRTKKPRGTAAGSNRSKDREGDNAIGGLGARPEYGPVSSRMAGSTAWAPRPRRARCWQSHRWPSASCG